MKGSSLSYSKSADNQSIARKRAEESDGLRREEKRRLVDTLLGQQDERIRRAGGKAWGPTSTTAGSSANPSRKRSPTTLIEAAPNGETATATSETTSALDTRMPETLEAAFAQELETALKEFPEKSADNGQIPAPQVNTLHCQNSDLLADGHPPYTASQR
jgi:hypothetical protein